MSNLDDRILLGIHEHLRSDAMDDVVQVVTRGGGTFWIYALVAILVLFAVRVRRTPEAIVIALGVWSAKLVNYLIKHAIHRHRPELWDTLVTERTPSFPSGHSAGAAALACAAILFAWETRWRVPVTVIAILYAITIGFTRMYLGVHYPSDVAAGWFVGALWMAGCWRLTHRWRTA